MIHNIFDVNNFEYNMQTPLPNFQLNIKTKMDQNLIIDPIIIDGLYIMIVHDFELSEINKGLKYLFRQRQHARQQYHKSNPDYTPHSIISEDFKLQPINNLDGTFTITVNVHEMEQIVKGLKYIDRQRTSNKKSKEKQKPENYIMNDTQNTIKLKIVNPM